MVGLMSGTSADGVDACVTRLSLGDEDGRTILAHEILHFETRRYGDELREAILSAASVEDVCRLNFAVAEAFAESASAAMDAAGLKADDILAVASHGQTLFHAPHAAPIGGFPARSTLQVGDISVIAARTGIRTVGGFRAKDMALGGQGAPLVPFVDHLLTPPDGAVWVNIGGIANITAVCPGAPLEEVIAFDTGPGNCLLDRLVFERTGGKMRYDKSGTLALAGKVDEALLADMLSHPYFVARPPKSTGPEEFGDEFLRRYGLPSKLADACATLAALTADSVALGIESACAGHRSQRVLVSGGGIHNSAIMKGLSSRLAPAKVNDTGAVGIPPDAKEAFAFAALGFCTIHGMPNNAPSATGASRRAVLGQVASPD